MLKIDDYWYFNEYCVICGDCEGVINGMCPKDYECPQCGAKDDKISIAGNGIDEPYHYVCSSCGLHFDKF